MKPTIEDFKNIERALSDSRVYNVSTNKIVDCIEEDGLVYCKDVNGAIVCVVSKELAKELIDLPQSPKEAE